MATRRPVAYIRRSVSRKNDPGDVSRAFQTDKVRDLAGADAARLAIIDQDWGRSAAGDKTSKRLAFLDLMAQVERGEVSTLYAYSADRLARSVRWSAQLIDACEAAGTTIVTGEGRFAPGDDMARQLFHFQAMQNEGTLRQMATKARSGIAARRARGDDLGSFRYGYATNAKERARGEPVRWVRDPSVPLDEVLSVVQRNGGNVLASCRDLDSAGIAAPRGGARWSTSALTRVVEREAPHLLPPRNRASGQRRPTRSVLSHLVTCPACGVSMTPVGTRDALYCRNGSRVPDHGKAFTKAGPILAMLHEQTDERTFTRLTIRQGRATDADALAEAEERWRRANVRYQAGGIADGEYLEEKRRHDAAVEAYSEEPALDVLPGQPYVRWDADTATVNADLRRVFAEVRLDPETLAPVEAVWRRALAREQRRARRDGPAVQDGPGGGPAA